MLYYNILFLKYIYFVLKNKYSVSPALIVDLLAKYYIFCLGLKALKIYLPTDSGFLHYTCSFHSS